ELPRVGEALSAPFLRTNGEEPPRQHRHDRSCVETWVPYSYAIDVELKLCPVVSADDMVPLTPADRPSAGALRKAVGVRRMYPLAIRRTHKEDHSCWCGRDRDAKKVGRHE